jgi:hypothetical protein
MSETIQALGQQLQALTRQAQQVMQADTDDIIRSGDRDTARIEHLLDLMLGFCFDPAVLVQFKSLCRYYFALDPVATAGHVHAYREMWDEAAEAGRAGV